MDVLLAPHHDDETLFAAYTLLRHRPLVVVCLRSDSGYGPEAVRDAETAAATRVLGCDHITLAHSDSGPDWDVLERDLRALGPSGQVFAPAPEPGGGHAQHDRIGQLALELWPGRVTLYLTYTHRNGKSTWGEPVPFEPGWAELKREALACYPSQASDPRTGMHFSRPLDEFYAPQSPTARS